MAAHRPELAQTRSKLERRFLSFCERFAIPIPEVNIWVEGFRVDAVWRDAHVVVELDGGDAHATVARMENDRQRDLALRSAGYVVLRYTSRQVKRQPKLVAADLLRALERPA
jgi:very-short-patch-repair endonuclease